MLHVLNPRGENSRFETNRLLHGGITARARTPYDNTFRGPRPRVTPIARKRKRSPSEREANDRSPNESDDENVCIDLPFAYLGRTSDRRNNVLLGGRLQRAFITAARSRDTNNGLWSRMIADRKTRSERWPWIRGWTRRKGLRDNTRRIVVERHSPR